MTVAAFVADIPDVTCEQLAKLYAWTQSKFKESKINMNADRASYTLCAVCLDGSSKTVRQWQSLIRTNLINWGVEMPKAQQKLVAWCYSGRVPIDHGPGDPARRRCAKSSLESSE